jgi:DNA-binding response OmpR family regulator
MIVKTPAILVVDENTAARTEVMELLSCARYQVAGAGNFMEAKTALSTLVPDLLITELRLGDFNGLHLVVRARSSQSAIATIVLTRFPDPVLEAEAKRLGAAYLVNPVKPAELLTVVSRELGMGLEPRHAPECSEPPNPMAALHQ